MTESEYLKIMAEKQALMTAFCASDPYNQKPKKTRIIPGLGGWLVIAIGVAWVVGIVSSSASTPSTASSSNRVYTEQEQMQQRHDSRVTSAMGDVFNFRRTMHDPLSFSVNSAYLTKTGNVCFEYRAKNGFGALRTAHGIITNKNQIDSSRLGEQFTKHWTKHCSGTAAVGATKLRSDLFTRTTSYGD